MVWYFVGVCTINRTLPGRLEIASQFCVNFEGLVYLFMFNSEESLRLNNISPELRRIDLWGCLGSDVKKEYCLSVDFGFWKHSSSLEQLLNFFLKDSQPISPQKV